MTGNRKKRALRVALSLIPALFLVDAFLQSKIDAQTRGIGAQSEELLLQSPAAVKRFSLGYDALLADIYWTRAVQYYGKNVATANPDFTLLWPLLDLATTLDPKLVAAYHFGAIFLSEPENVGAGRADLAVELVKRGVAANPNNWQLGTDLGFLYYWRMKDYPDAAATYLTTSKIPNAPSWIRMMAARIAQTGGSLETSQMIWTQIYNSTSDPSVNKLAYEQLQGLKARLDMAHLDEIAENFNQRFGHYPTSSAEMRDAGFLTGIPVDPAGYRYEIDPNGKAYLNAHTTFVLPPEPKKLSAPSN